MKAVDDALVKRAEALFNEHGKIITGHGLTRRELRRLERVGLIERQLMRNRDTGTLIYEWKPVSAAEGVAKDIKIT